MTHPLHFVGAQYFLRKGGKHTFRDIHHIMEIRIGLIQLNGGKFRVMLGVHALIAEDTTNLVDPVHAADDQAFQGQLCCDAHVHINVQRVVVGDERTGRCAACDGVQHRGLHFDVAHVVQIVAQMLDESGAEDEVLLHLGIDHQIHIALAETHFLIGQAMVLLGQGQQRLGQQHNGSSAHRYLTGLGFENLALTADDVANVVLLELVIRLFAQLVDLDEQLDAAGIVLQIAEHDLALTALAHETAGHTDGLAFVSFVIRFDGSRIRSEIKLGDQKGIAAFGLQRRQLIAADLRLLRHRQFCLGYKLRHGLSPREKR